MTTLKNYLDLTKRPPRSARVRLGGYAMLPRILDKARASIDGNAGDYIYGNPMDQNFLRFTGISQESLLATVASGKGDWEILKWVNLKAVPKRFPHEIRAWSAQLETAPIGDAEDFEWFTEQVKRIHPGRTDLHSVIDYLDADDHVSFGGHA
jgi:hypothetical protein